MALKAIETRYKGYRFRSRLEARWAVYFDALHVAWEYEVQGFAVDGRPYLPDFYIREFDAYAEVKPLGEDVDWSLLTRLATESGRCAIALIGAPDHRWYPVVCPPVTFEHLGGKLETVPAHIDWIDFPTSMGDGSIWLWGASSTPDFLAPLNPNGRDAVELARGARFEHGETPR